MGGAAAAPDRSSQKPAEGQEAGALGPDRPALARRRQAPPVPAGRPVLRAQSHGGPAFARPARAHDGRVQAAARGGDLDGVVRPDASPPAGSHELLDGIPVGAVKVRQEDPGEGRVREDVGVAEHLHVLRSEAAISSRALSLRPGGVVVVQQGLGAPRPPASEAGHGAQRREVTRPQSLPQRAALREVERGKAARGDPGLDLVGIVAQVLPDDKPSLGALDVLLDVARIEAEHHVKAPAAEAKLRPQPVEEVDDVVANLLFAVVDIGRRAEVLTSVLGPARAWRAAHQVLPVASVVATDHSSRVPVWPDKGEELAVARSLPRARAVVQHHVADGAHAAAMQCMGEGPQVALVHDGVPLAWQVPLRVGRLARRRRPDVAEACVCKLCRAGRQLPEELLTICQAWPVEGLQASNLRHSRRWRGGCRAPTAPEAHRHDQNRGSQCGRQHGSGAVPTQPRRRLP
mmetsp:Transcript_108196/g.316420  ORF Transcript_108196/g.316420 Transcript_108196/m.316420 type:complete len:460 (-) Transcript_108196:56-1435(-)